MRKTILAFLALVFIGTTPGYGFEVMGSRRVPTVVPRDTYLRDPQYVSARVISADRAYEVHYFDQMGHLCAQEWRPINNVDYRDLWSQLFNPRGPVYTEPQYNCYDTAERQEQRVFVGYMVTFEYLGEHYTKLVDHRPGKYIKVLIK